jgi:hypothetical protein
VLHHGWKFFDKIYYDFVDEVLEELIDRMEEAIAVGKGITTGDIPPEDAKRIITFWIIPPVLVSRADLLQGTTRLIYGNSCDITFMGLDDRNREVLFAINFHFEEGLPTNYWYVRRGEETLERRHMKLGEMLKDIPKKFNTLAEAGDNIIPILKDIRNERDPEHANSAYNVCFFYFSMGTNNGLSMTNYDEYSFMWEGINCGKKKHWNRSANGSKTWVKDAGQMYEPWPPIFLQLTLLPRVMWIKRIAGLLTGSQVFIQYTMRNYDKKGLADIEGWQRWMWEKGVPLPKGVFERRMPDLSLKNQDDWIYGYTYPEDTPRMTLDDLGITLEEARKGVLLDTTWESTEIPTSKNIISIGHGVDTKFLKEV